MTFEIYQDKRGEWRWRLKALNNRTIADSGEGYQQKEMLLKTLNVLIEQIAHGSFHIVFKES